MPVVDTWDLRGEKGPPYKVGPKCSNPSCGNWADHAHHLVRRSQLAGDYQWVKIDGVLYANLTGLCVRCHDEITGRVGGHRAAIRLVDGVFYWSGLQQKGDEIVYLPLAPLDPQPPSPDSLTQRASTHEEHGSEFCPYCGQTKRRRQEPQASGSGRRRKSWTVLAPDDQEDGVAVLETLAAELAPVMGIEPNRTGRYYIVAGALYYAVQNMKEFVQSWQGVG